MFDWLGDIFQGIGGVVGNAFSAISSDLVNSIFDNFIMWLYQQFYKALADFFTQMQNLGVELFELKWVDGVVTFFVYLGWALFATGTVVAAFDLAIEYQNGRANIKSSVLNILKGFFACSLIGTVPIELYKFCVTLQNTFSGDLAGIFVSTRYASIVEGASDVLEKSFKLTEASPPGPLVLIMLIAYGYCIVKIFFQNIKRGGILLIQMAVGSLYMFSVPRGYTDGFYQWIRQVVAICLTAFMQTTMLFLSLMTMETNMILALGIMLAANEVPRIAQQFGLDSSVKVNMMSVVHASTTAVNLARSVARA